MGQNICQLSICCDRDDLPRRDECHPTATLVVGQRV